MPLTEEDGLGMLELRFDDLSGDYVTWEVRVVHCDRHWQPSDMHPSEYIQGFHTTPMADEEASFGTKVDYTHHQLVLPNEDLKWTRSGNYLLEVFDPAEPETPVIVRRFVVYEDLCRVEAQTGEPSDLALSRTHQEIHFSIFEEGYSLSDPYDRLHVSVVPNWRWDRAVGGLQPRFIKGAEIDFQRAGYVFEGGNTHRFADLKGLEFTARGVARLEERVDHFYFYLEQDERRTYDYFGGGEDIHGAMVTYNDRLEAFTGSDYVWVHWRLDTRHPLVNRDIYLVGAMSQHQCLMRSAWNTTKHKASTPIATCSNKGTTTTTTSPASEAKSQVTQARCPTSKGPTFKPTTCTPSSCITTIGTATTASSDLHNGNPILDP